MRQSGSCTRYDPTWRHRGKRGAHSHHNIVYRPASVSRIVGWRGLLHLPEKRPHSHGFAWLWEFSHLAPMQPLGWHRARGPTSDRAAGAAFLARPAREHPSSVRASLRRRATVARPFLQRIRQRPVDHQPGARGGVERLLRDALGASAACWLFLLAGVNDIGIDNPVFPDVSSTRSLTSLRLPTDEGHARLRGAHPALWRVELRHRSQRERTPGGEIMGPVERQARRRHRPRRRRARPRRADEVLLATTPATISLSIPPATMEWPRRSTDPSSSSSCSSQVADAHGHAGRYPCRSQPRPLTRLAPLGDLSPLRVATFQVTLSCHGGGAC
jgi:hypothetical protein